MSNRDHQSDRAKSASPVASAAGLRAAIMAAQPIGEEKPDGAVGSPTAVGAQRAPSRDGDRFSSDEELEEDDPVPQGVKVFTLKPEFTVPYLGTLKAEVRPFVTRFLANFMSKDDIRRAVPQLTLHGCDGRHCGVEDGYAGARAFLYSSLEESVRGTMDCTPPAVEYADEEGREVMTRTQFYRSRQNALTRAVVSAIELDEYVEPLDEIQNVLPEVGQTISEMILGKVREHEHEGHLVGTDMSRQIGATLAKAYWIKVCVVVSLLVHQGSAAGINTTAGALLGGMCQYREVPLWLGLAESLMLACQWFYASLTGAYWNTIGWYWVAFARGTAFRQNMVVCEAFVAPFPLDSNFCTFYCKSWEGLLESVFVWTVLGLLCCTVAITYWSLKVASSWPREIWLFWRAFGTYFSHYVKCVWRFVTKLRFHFGMGLVPNGGGTDAFSIPRWPNTSMIEMSMNGSSYGRTTLQKGMLCILKFDGKAGYSHIGFGFRVKNYLITAEHVWRRTETTPGDTVLAGLRHDGDYMVPVTGPLKPVHTVEPGSFVDVADTGGKLLGVDDFAQMYDVSILQFDSSVFSKIGVGSLKFGSAGVHSTVDTFAYFPPAIKRASGRVVEGGAAMNLYYTSSTRDGSSGSPVMMGTKVVALHQGTEGSSANRGLDASLMQLVIHKYEDTVLEDYDDIYEDKRKGVFRDHRGRVVEVEQLDFGFMLTDRSGRKRALPRDAIKDFMEIQERLEDEGIGSRFEYAQQPLRVDTSPVAVGFNDEQSILGARIEPQPTAPVTRPPTPIVDQSFLAGTPLEEDPKRLKPLVAPKFKGFNQEVSGMIDWERAKALGYDPEKFAFPEYDDARAGTETSFKNHVSRVLKPAFCKAKAPSAEVLSAARRFMLESLSKANYQAIEEPLSDESIDAIINSTLIEGSKSPGRYFMSNGMLSNEAVLERFDNKAMAEMVRELMSCCKPEVINVFIKLEPTKRRKLLDEMARLISGMDLRETILAQAFFANFNSAMAASYKATGVLVGWSPLKPGDGRWFHERHNRKKTRLLGSDCQTFDWTYAAWAIREVSEIIVRMARRPRTMSEESFQAWRVDARNVIMRQFTMPFALPSGRVFNRTCPAIMSSGSVLTLAFNSIMMKYLDTCAKLEMDAGYTLTDLLAKFTSSFGGDDGLQNVPLDFAVEEYRDKLNGYGLTVPELSTADSINGCEFFSWLFGVDRFGSPTWVPTRFTKHLENLRVVATEVLPDALRSAMLNWVHDGEKFEFFRSIYMRGRERDHRAFHLEMAERLDLIEALNGLEGAWIPTGWLSL